MSQIKAIHQVLSTFSGRDAIGSDAILIQAALRRQGYASEIYFEQFGEPETSHPLAKLALHYHRSDTAIMFHFSIGSQFSGTFVNLSNFKIVRYHNVTPPEFFSHAEEANIRSACSLGRLQIPMLARFSDLVLADSAYNASEFARYASIKTAVLPVFRDYQYLQALAPSAGRRDSDRPLLLFVGRISPNKAQHDLLKLIALYKATFKESLGLILVGKFFSETFKDEVLAYAAFLQLKITDKESELEKADVLIAGGSSDKELASWYRRASAYCSLSEHEGFGVPLVESMQFGLPVIAHREAAVPETLGEAGYFVDKRNWSETMIRIRSFFKDPALRQRYREKGEVQGAHFSLKNCERKLNEALTLLP